MLLQNEETPKTPSGTHPLEAREPVPPSQTIRFLNPNRSNPKSAHWLGNKCLITVEYQLLRFVYQVYTLPMLSHTEKLSPARKGTTLAAPK